MKRTSSSSLFAQVMAAATALHGGGSLHALAFSDGKAQILSAAGSVAASARVFESSAPYVFRNTHKHLQIIVGPHRSL
jgi:hypothetical protein